MTNSVYGKKNVGFTGFTRIKHSKIKQMIDV